MKKIMMLVTAAFLLNAASAYAETKVGIIDLNKILASDPQVKAAQAQLKRDFDPRKSEIDAAQKAFQTEVNKYNKDSANLKGDGLKQAQQKLLATEKKFHDLRDKFQGDLMNAQNKSMQEILKKVEETVNKIATSQKYDLVLTKASTAYINPNLEITQMVIEKLKEGKK